MKSDQKKIKDPIEPTQKTSYMFLKTNEWYGRTRMSLENLHPTLSQQWMVMMYDLVSTETFYRAFSRCYATVISEHGEVQ